MEKDSPNRVTEEGVGEVSLIKSLIDSGAASAHRTPVKSPKKSLVEGECVVCPGKLDLSKLVPIPKKMIVVGLPSMFCCSSKCRNVLKGSELTTRPKGRRVQKLYEEWATITLGTPLRVGDTVQLLPDTSPNRYVEAGPGTIMNVRFDSHLQEAVLRVLHDLDKRTYEVTQSGLESTPSQPRLENESLDTVSAANTRLANVNRSLYIQHAHELEERDRKHAEEVDKFKQQIQELKASSAVLVTKHTHDVEEKDRTHTEELEKIKQKILEDKVVVDHLTNILDKVSKEQSRLKTTLKAKPPSLTPDSFASTSSIVEPPKKKPATQRKLTASGAKATRVQRDPTEETFLTSGASPSSSSSQHVDKWECVTCTFLNRPRTAVCSMCKTPWQAPFVLPPAPTSSTLGFTLPVPLGYRVMGQDVEGLWCFERDVLEPAKKKRRHQQKGGGSATTDKGVDLLTNAAVNPPTQILRHCLLNTSSLRLSSAAATSRVKVICPHSPRGCNGDISSGSTFVAVGNDFLIEELGVECDEIGGLKILSCACEF